MGGVTVTVGIVVYVPAVTPVIAVTVPPLLMFTPLEPDARSIAPVPLLCMAREMFASVPWVYSRGEKLVAAPVAVK